MTDALGGVPSRLMGSPTDALGGLGSNHWRSLTINDVMAVGLTVADWSTPGGR